jgi:hypothetical protein
MRGADEEMSVAISRQTKAARISRRRQWKLQAIVYLMAPAVGRPAEPLQQQEHHDDRDDATSAPVMTIENSTCPPPPPCCAS